MRKQYKIAIGLGAVAASVSLVGYLLTRKPELTPAEFAVSDLVISPREVYPGEPVSITVTVTNTGETAGSATITCEVI